MLMHTGLKGMSVSIVSYIFCMPLPRKGGSISNENAVMYGEIREFNEFNEFNGVNEFSKFSEFNEFNGFNGVISLMSLMGLMSLMSSGILVG